MRRMAVTLTITLAIAAGDLAGRAEANVPCGKQDKESYRRKADLPVGAIEAMGVAIAEKGGAYQRGDVMVRGLPLYRFVSATRSGCSLSIAYERGGFTHHSGEFLLSRTDGIWRLVGRD